MQHYVDVIAAHFKANPINLANEYVWPRRPVPFDQTFEKRMQLSMTFNSEPQLRGLLATQMVGVWGGINKGLESVKNEMATETPEQLINRGISRVASWSKVLVLHDPEKFLIYDARVAWAVNLILCKSQAISIYFPMPPSQNSQLKKAEKSSQGKRLKSSSSKIFQGLDFYTAFLFLAGAVGKKLELPAWQVEMALFARGPELTKGESRNQCSL